MLKTFTVGLLASFSLLLAQNGVKVPTESGLYVLRDGGKVERIEGRVTSFERTGSRLASTVTAGIHTAKTNAQISGERARVKVTSTPVFYYRVASGAEAAGGSVGDLVLTRMTVKHGRRQFEIAAQGLGRASKGISLRHQVDFDAREVEPGVYKLVPVNDLEAGEYGFYLFRGQGMHGFVHDFGVE